AERQADALRENIERLLVARVGPGNAMVQVNVELISERETVLERRIDPASRVIVATESEASSSSARNSDAGAVTVASNLPEREASEGDQSSEQGSETRERTEYDHSILTREVESGPDRIRRITVAVLVNGQIETDATGAEVLVPRSDAELEALGALVQSAIGFDAERGDQVTIRSLAFEALPDAGTATAGTGGLFSSLDVAQLIRGGLLALVALAVIFGVVRPALASAGTARPAGSLPQPDDVAIRDDLNPPGDDTADDPLDLGGLPGLPALGDAPAWDGEIITSDAPDDAFDSGSDDPVDRLRRLIEEREAETVEILRSWMEEDEEATR
ncbi:MAG: flagellar M-ring protein FliF C-terminal domain-containing protein, partial [Pseudomonadota bacterium]